VLSTKAKVVKGGDDMAALLTPADIAKCFVQAGVKPVRVAKNARSKTPGTWVSNKALSEVLESIINMPSLLRDEYHHGRDKLLTLNVAHICDGLPVNFDGSRRGLSDDETVFILAVDETEKHFWFMVVRQRDNTVHVFDTLQTRSNAYVWSILTALYPRFKSLCWRYSLHNYTVNSLIRQTGATCGAWVAWICAAYLINYNNCRKPGVPAVDVSRLNVRNVEAFWQGMTVV
jgi:hypothetical protein